MTDTIKLTYHSPCRCCRTYFKHEKTLCYVKDGQILYVKPIHECIHKTKTNNVKFDCWNCFYWSHL